MPTTHHCPYNTPGCTHHHHDADPEPLCETPTALLPGKTVGDWIEITAQHFPDGEHSVGLTTPDNRLDLDPTTAHALAHALHHAADPTTEVH